MKYTEEIQKKQAEIKQLEKQQVDEMKKTFPNVVGKIYRPSASSLWKVKEITHIFSPTHCLADVVNVTVRKSQHTEISTSYNVEIDIVDMDEVTEERFNRQIDEAIECLRLQCE